MTANGRILDRLQFVVDAYRRGEISLQELQAAVLAHGEAIEGLGREWRELLVTVEGQLELIRFTLDDDAQAAAAD